MANTSYSPVPLSMSDWYPWCQLMARAINNILGGKQNVTTTLTFTASSATTTLTDSRIGSASFIWLSPLTANAASLEGEGWYVSSQLEGSAVINHANSSFADRTYRVVIFG